MRFLHYRRLLLALPLSWAAGRVIAQAPQAALRDSLVKAAFLHKFASFVEWPAGVLDTPESQLRIGVLGDEQVYQDLAELTRDRGRDGRQVTAVLLLPGDSFAGLHILYARGDAARIASVWSRVPEGVLTVADSQGAHPPGSVLSFYLEDGRVRFGASQQAAARQKLRLNARLLSVAKVVGGDSVISDLA